MPINRWGGCSFLSIDPGVNVTGWAVHKTSLQGVARLTRYGAFVPHAKLESEHERILYVVDAVRALVHETAPVFVYVEQPPFTIYYQKKLPPAALVARAQSVFKTVAICFAILTFLKFNTKTIGMPIFPSQWQDGKRQRGGLDSKEWSLAFANQIIRETISIEAACLSTKKDENIADAICLGHIAFRDQFLPA